MATWSIGWCSTLRCPTPRLARRLEERIGVWARSTAAAVAGASGSDSVSSLRAAARVDTLTCGCNPRVNANVHF